MPRPPIKKNDPAWQAARKADRHRGKTTITLHLSPEARAAWAAQAQRDGAGAVSRWVITVITQYVAERGSDRV